MSHLPRATALLLSALLVSPATLLAADPIKDAVAYRQALMGVLAWNANRMAAMAKGEVPFDAAVFTGHAKDLAAAANLDALKGFPEESVTEDSDAKDEIWLNWADFQSKLNDLRTQSAKLVEVTAGGDQAAMLAQLDDTRGTCKACHKEYKQ